MAIAPGALRQLLVAALIYGMTSVLGIWLSGDSGDDGMLWPGAAIMLGLAARTGGTSRLGLVSVCAALDLALHLLSGQSFSASFGLVGSRVAEVGCAIILFKWIRCDPNQLKTLREAAVFLLAAVLLAPLVGVAIRASTSFVHLDPSSWQYLATGWIHEAAGMMLVAPALLTWGKNGRLHAMISLVGRIPVAAEIAAVSAVLVLMLGMNVTEGNPDLAGLFALPLIWLAVRFGLGPTTIASVTLYLMTVIALHIGSWPTTPVRFDAVSGYGLALQAFVALAALASMIAAVVVEEHHRAREALVLRESRFGDALQGSDEGLWQLDIGTATFSGSSRWAEILGIGQFPIQTSLMALVDLVHPDDRDALSRAITALLENEAAISSEFRVRRPSSPDGWVQLRGSVVERDGQNRPCHAAGTLTDISRHKQAELAVGIANRRFRAVVETAVDGIVTIDAYGAIQTFNPSAERIFGYTAGEIIGRNIKELMPEPFRSEHDTYLERYRTTGERRIIGIGRTVRGRRKNGTTFPLHLSVGQAGDDTDTFFIGILRDVSDREQLEIELIGAKGQLDNALDAMEDGFALFSPDDRLVTCNRRFRDMFPRTADLRVPGIHFDTLVREAVRRGEYVGVDGMTGCDIERWIVEKTAYHSAAGRHELQLPDGRWLDVVARRTSSGNRIAIYRDITERHQLLVELSDAKTTLHDALTSVEEALAIVDEQDRLILVNDRVAALFPRSASSWVPGRNLEEMWREIARNGELDGVDESNFTRWLLECRAKAMTGSGNETKLADGRWFRSVRRRTQHGGWVVAIHDITEQKRLHGELEEVRERLASALDGANAGTWDWNVTTGAIVCDERWAALCGLGLEELPNHIEEWRSLVHPEDVEDVSRRLTDHLEGRIDSIGIDFRMRHAELGWVWLHGRGKVVTRDRDGNAVRATGTVMDITERKKLERDLGQQALYDQLTGLSNRYAFQTELTSALARASRSGSKVGILLVDLDRFKDVNDSYGHAIGDLLLVEIAQRLRAHVRGGDTIARLGGDEFALIAQGEDVGEFESLARRLVDALGAPVRIKDHVIRPGASIGFTLFPDDHGTTEELLVHADRALYAAKGRGRRTWAKFTPGMTTLNGGGMIASAFLPALQRGEFELHYQPIIEIETLRLIGVEALLRWNRPGHGIVPASAFISALERRPIIQDVSRYVLCKVLRQQREWRDEFYDLQVWVNLAPRCLLWDGMIDAVTSELAAADVPADRLVLEITEGALADLDQVRTCVSSLRAFGVRVAIDDFGTGYSSLGRLRTLPMDAVKIDRSFVMDLAREERDRATVRTIVALGQNLGLTPLAEGIETVEQLAIVRQLGCVWGQGYLFAKPMPGEALASWLQQWEERQQVTAEFDLLRRQDRTG